MHPFRGAEEHRVLPFCCKGVGSVILGVFDENKIRQYISLPENERVTNLIALGYPLEQAKSAPPRKEVSELLDIIE